MPLIIYSLLGIVESPIVEPLCPEVIRTVEARLVLAPRFAPAVATLELGQHLLVVYHLHRSEAWHDGLMTEWLTRRIACRPNPIGVTLRGCLKSRP